MIYQEYLPKTKYERELCDEFFSKIKKIKYVVNSWNIYCVYYRNAEQKQAFEKYMEEYGYDYKFWRISNKKNTW